MLREIERGRETFPSASLLRWAAKSPSRKLEKDVN